MTVVSNTSPIIALSTIGELGLLERLFGRILIPRGVYEELSEVQPFACGDWILVKDIHDRKRYGQVRIDLDHGEAEAIVLYSE